MAGGDWGNFDPGSIPLSRPADQVVVFRARDPNDLSDLEYITNILCTAITVREGAHPPTASFRYVFDPNFIPADLPQRFHQVYGNIVSGDGIVEIDDRLLVVRILGGSDPSGDSSSDSVDFMYLFDGFVTNPQASADGSREHVTIEAVATPAREWDFVLPGSVWSTENPKDNDDVSIYSTEVPARFNPNGKPNACDTSMVWTGKYYFNDPDNDQFYAFVSTHPDNKYFLFDGTNTTQNDIKQWTLGMAARYIVGVGVEWPLGMGGTVYRKKPYVSVYDMLTWDSLFQSIVPTNDGAAVDLTDSSTFKRQDIACPDVEVTGEAWPNALEKLIKPFGFLFRFDLRTNNDGTPEWLLTCYRSDDAKLQTTMSLQATDDIVFDPAKTNVGAIQIQRDAVHVANEFEVDTQLVAYEATFVLAPAFPIDPADATNLEQWRGEHADPKKRDYYKKFVFGEGNTLWWHPVSTRMKQSRPENSKEGNLDALFDTILTTEEAKKRPPYAIRNRKPFGHLNTLDPGGRPYFWKLAISTINLAGDPPGNPFYTGGLQGGGPSLWDGTGKWKKVQTTQCSLLEDEIGIRITCDTPAAWHTGEPTSDADDIMGGNGVVDMVTRLAAPFAPDGLRPVLALTCVIFGDKDLDATATLRKSSISRFRIRRKIDARDRWKRQVVTTFSMTAMDVFGEEGFGNDEFIDLRDDTEDAKDAAVAMQRVHEMGSHSGTVTIRRLSTAYNVGQTVTQIVGRGVDLLLNASAPGGETKLYPRIASMTFNLENEQTTTITLTDERAQPITRRQAYQLRTANHHRQAQFGN